MHRGPPVPAEELLERPVAVAVGRDAERFVGGGARHPEGAGALLRGGQRPAGQLEGDQGDGGGVERGADRQGGGAADRERREPVPDGDLGQLPDDVGHHVQSAEETAAGDSHENRMEQDRVV